MKVLKFLGVWNFKTSRTTQGSSHQVLQDLKSQKDQELQEL